MLWPIELIIILIILSRMTRQIMPILIPTRENYSIHKHALWVECTCITIQIGEKTLFKCFVAKSVDFVNVYPHECHFNAYHCNLEGYESHQDLIMFPQWLLRFHGTNIVAHLGRTILASRPAILKHFILSSKSLEIFYLPMYNVY